MSPFVDSRVDSSSSTIEIKATLRIQDFNPSNKRVGSVAPSYVGNLSKQIRLKILYVGIDTLFRDTSDAQHIRHPHQISERVCLHLAHSISPVDLHGNLADAHLGRDLLVHKTRGHQPN